MPRSTEPVGTDLLRIDDELSDEERLVRDTVRKFAADRILPHIADWFEAGTLPAELAPELGQLGLLGMHLTGYGCAGMGSIAYGVTCREMEAADSGLRSLVSVQGSLAMFPIWKYGSEEQKNEWLPQMAAGRAIGCFGLTEPDHGSDPASMKTQAKRNRGSAASWCRGLRAASPPAISIRNYPSGPRSPPNCISMMCGCPLTRSCRG
jgi:glutaryl-CoA dehydrogenase